MRIRGASSVLLPNGTEFTFGSASPYFAAGKAGSCSMVRSRPRANMRRTRRWAVGGAVRDALAGLHPKDWDVATAAHPEAVRRLFRRTVPIGIEHGTVGVFGQDRVLYEVTTFRRDVETTGRHAVVEFGASLEEDLARRDFTINAIAEDADGIGADTDNCPNDKNPCQTDTDGDGIPAPLVRYRLSENSKRMMAFGVERAREAGRPLAIWMMTGGRSPDLEQRCLAAGALALLAKPFDLNIFLARLNGLLRRRDWARSESRLGAGDTITLNGRSVDLENLILKHGDEIIHLTLMEAKLLQYLIENEGRPVSRKAILEEVWDLQEDTDTRAIDNFIVRLRKHLEDEPNNPSIVQTVRGVGYRFIMPEK